MAAKKNETEAVVHPLRQMLDTLRPGSVQVRVGGEVKEGALTGFSTVTVPLTEDGLPKASEVLYRGWTTNQNKKINADSIGKGGEACGTYQYPVLVNGVVRYIEGRLRAWSNPNPHFSLSTAKPSTWKSVDDDGKVTENSRWIPIFKSLMNDPQLNRKIADDRDMEALMGQVVAHQMGIEII